MRFYSNPSGINSDNRDGSPTDGSITRPALLELQYVGERDSGRSGDRGGAAHWRWRARDNGGAWRLAVSAAFHASQVHTGVSGESLSDVFSAAAPGDVTGADRIRGPI